MTLTLANYPTLDTRADHGPGQTHMASPSSAISVTLLTGGFDRPYALGLCRALISKSVRLEVIAGKELDSVEMHTTPELTFLNLHGDQRQTVNRARKFLRHIVLYGRLLCYAANAKPRIFHILWNNKFPLFDRTILMLYYKLLGKKIALTAHNVNAAQRDGHDSALNRLSLKVQYRLVDHIFVHTDKMKAELLNEFGVMKEAVSVIPFGINNSVPDTELTSTEAKQRIGVRGSSRTILFFGGIRPYKGLEYLVEAFLQVACHKSDYRLIIAGEPKREALQYWQEIRQKIERTQIGGQIIQEIRFIADSETEVYFKAADIVVLPYTLVFQSGVLFLAHNFGVPVIATDVGSLRDAIVEGVTGYICRPCDSSDLARTIEAYFDSSLYRTLDHRRAEIRAFAQARNSWDIVSDRTCNVYSQLLPKQSLS